MSARLLLSVLLLISSSSLASNQEASKENQRLVLACKYKEFDRYLIAEQVELDDGGLVNPDYGLYPFTPAGKLYIVSYKGENSSEQVVDLETVFTEGTVDQVIEGEVSHMFHQTYHFRTSKREFELSIYGHGGDGVMKIGDSGAGLRAVNCDAPRVAESSLEEMAAAQEWKFSQIYTEDVTQNTN